MGKLRHTKGYCKSRDKNSQTQPKRSLPLRLCCPCFQLLVSKAGIPEGIPVSQNSQIIQASPHLPPGVRQEATLPRLTRMMLWQVPRGSPTRLVPLTDMRRSPMLSSPDRSAGPPCIRLAMTTVGRMEPQPDSTMAMPKISPFCFRMQTWGENRWVMVVTSTRVVEAQVPAHSCTHSWLGWGLVL